jgi:hypothetical protein
MENEMAASRSETIGVTLDAWAHDWRLSRAGVAWIAGLPVIVALSGVAAAGIGKAAYKWLTQDDSLAENLQVLFFGLACLLAIGLSRRLLERSERALCGLYALVAVGLFFLVGEEVSWGQRIFGWATPEGLEEVNRQGETNVHNVYGVRMLFKWAQLVIGAYGTILPFALPRWGVLAPYRDWLSWLVPHVSLVPYFAFLLIWRVYRNLFDPPEQLYFVISEYNEILELNLALGFFFFMWYQWRRG